MLLHVVRTARGQCRAPAAQRAGSVRLRRSGLTCRGQVCQQSRLVQGQLVSRAQRQGISRVSRSRYRFSAADVVVYLEVCHHLPAVVWSSAHSTGCGTMMSLLCRHRERAEMQAKFCPSHTSRASGPCQRPDGNGNGMASRTVTCRSAFGAGEKKRHGPCARTPSVFMVTAAAMAPIRATFRRQDAVAAAYWGCKEPGTELHDEPGVGGWAGVGGELDYLRLCLDSMQALAGEEDVPSPRLAS